MQQITFKIEGGEDVVAYALRAKTSLKLPEKLMWRLTRLAREMVPAENAGSGLHPATLSALPTVIFLMRRARKDGYWPARLQ